LFADSATDALGIINNPGFAINHFKKSIGTIHDTLKTAGAFLQIDLDSHPDKPLITISKLQKYYQ
jgi:hypothetical protein